MTPPRRRSTPTSPQFRTQHWRPRLLRRPPELPTGSTIYGCTQAPILHETLLRSTGSVGFYRVFKERMAARAMLRPNARLQPMRACHCTLQAADHTERPVQVRPCFGMRNPFSGEMLLITPSPPTLWSTVLGTLVNFGRASSQASLCPGHHRVTWGPVPDSKNSCSHLPAQHGAIISSAWHNVNCVRLRNLSNFYETSHPTQIDRRSQFL